MFGLEKCPKCGFIGVLYSHHYEEKNDKYGWLGLKCPKCGYKQVNTKETAIMIRDIKRLEEAIQKEKIKRRSSWLGSQHE